MTTAEVAMTLLQSLPTRLLLVACAGPLAAQQSAPVASYHAARARVDRAIAALGGDTVLARLVVSTRFSGVQVQRHQSHRPEPPYERTPVTGEITLDFARRRIAYRQHTEFPGGFRSRTGFVNDGRDAWAMNFVRGTRAPATGAARTFNGAWTMVRRSPHWLILQARERAHTLREAGASTIDGRPQDVVSFATADGRLLWLHLDRGTGLPSAVAMLNHDPFLGDVEDRIAFGDWREEGGTRMPSVRRVLRAGELLEEVREETTVGATGPDSAFAVRASLRVDTLVTTPRTSELRPLAPGVHLLVAVQGQNSLVVEFADHLAVIEPYGDDGASRTAMATIARSLPGKPIRYIIATHHHDDHAGGVRAYLAAGATLVTTDANRGHFTRFARGRGSLPPDAVEVSGPPRLETFQARKVFADATRRLELIDIGPNPHTQEMLVAWLPAEGIMFQGDLLNAPWDDAPIAGNETTEYFSAWLARSGLDPGTIAAVHGPPKSLEQLRAAVARFAETGPP